MVAAANTIPDLTGHIVDGRYELVKMLGSGAFGVVYQAIDHHRARKWVAVKVMRLTGQNGSENTRIMREITLHHIVADIEGVVGFLDLVFDRDWCYVILEYYEGGDLFNRITNKHYAFNDALLRKSILSLIDALQAVHDAGVAHRDLKPENILTNKDGSELYLADFGLSTNEQMSSEFGVGTSLYMSPECDGHLTEKQPYDPYKSDIWSLGLVLVNMITGKEMWDKASPADKFFCEFFDDPNYLYDWLPISKGANDLIREMLYLDPMKRISLRNLREAILSLDSFFRPRTQQEHVVLEDECTNGSGLAASRSWATSNHQAADIDISRSASEPVVQVGRDCSDSSAVDVALAQMGVPDCNSSSGSRASSDESNVEKVVTPEGTTTTTTMKATIWEEMMMETSEEEDRDEHVCQKPVVTKRMFKQMLLRTRNRFPPR